MSVSSGAFYVLPGSGGVQVYIAAGKPVPPGAIPTGPTVSVGGNYTDLATGTTKYYPKNAPVPNGSVYVASTSAPAPANTLPISDQPSQSAGVSPGGSYISSSGDTIYVPAGQVIPAGWKPASTITTPTPGSIPFTNGSSTVYVVLNSTIIPKGYYPTQPGTYLYKAYDRSGLSFDTYQQAELLPPSGDGPIYLLSFSADASAVLQPTTEEIQEQSVTSPGGWYLSNTGVSMYVNKGDLVPVTWNWDTVKNAAPALTPLVPAVQPQTSTLVDKIAYAVGILGAVGVAYVGYLYVMKPNEIRYFLERFNELKCLFVDSAQLLAAIAVIAGISFVSYEFFTSYSKTGTFGGALGDMTARALEELAVIIIDVFEQLGKDLWDWFKKELEDLWNTIKPSWL